MCLCSHPQAGWQVLLEIEELISTLQEIFLNLFRLEFTANLIPCMLDILNLIYVFLHFFPPKNCFPIKNEHFPQMLCLLSIFSYLEKCSSLCACLLPR